MGLFVYVYDYKIAWKRDTLKIFLPHMRECVYALSSGRYYSQWALLLCSPWLTNSSWRNLAWSAVNKDCLSTYFPLLQHHSLSLSFSHPPTPSSLSSSGASCVLGRQQASGGLCMLPELLIEPVRQWNQLGCEEKEEGEEEGVTSRACMYECMCVGACILQHSS